MDVNVQVEVEVSEFNVGYAELRGIHGKISSK